MHLSLIDLRVIVGNFEVTKSIPYFQDIQTPVGLGIGIFPVYMFG